MRNHEPVAVKKTSDILANAKLILCLLVTALFCSAHAGDNDQLLWKFGKQKLSEGTNKFSIEITKSQISDEDGAGERKNTFTVLLDGEKNDMQCAAVELSITDKAELKKLGDILSDYVEHLRSARAKESKYQPVGDDDMNPTITSYSGSLGKFKVGFEFGMAGGHKTFDQDPYGGAVRLESEDDSNSKFIRILEPTALLFALNSLPTIQSKMADEIKALNEKQQKEEQAKIAKNELEAQKAETAQKETDDLAKQEFAKKAKAMIFMDSDEGQALLKQIQSQSTAMTTQYASEAADVIRIDGELKQLQKNITDFSLSSFDRQASSDALSDKVLELAQARNQFKPSEKLTKLMAAAKASVEEFNSKAGVSFADAMKYKSKP